MADKFGWDNNFGNNPAPTPRQKRMQQEREERERISMGIQCPECFGCNTAARLSRFDPKPMGFECQDCGCWWHTDRCAMMTLKSGG